MKVRTDLSIAIFRTFAKTGIGIPFTQADIRIHNIDQVRETIARSVPQLEERRSQNGQAAQTGSFEGR
jgi:small-conductance mechanosensitive channel